MSSNDFHFPNPVDALVNTMTQALLNTMNPATQKMGEKVLKGLENDPNFVSGVFALLENGGVDVNLKLASAIHLKNYVKANWNAESEEVSEGMRVMVKGRIVGLLVGIKVRAVQMQLSEAIVLIAQRDFPENWAELVPGLVGMLSGDYVQNNVILSTLYGIFKKYRHEFRTNKLFSEINYVMETFARPMLELLKATDVKIAEKREDGEMKAALEGMFLLSKIFYCLSCQDLPAFIEENMKEFMGVFEKYVLYENGWVEREGSVVVEKIKSVICDIVDLYLTRYEEEFTMLPSFIEKIWSLLMSLGKDTKYDILMGHAIQILTSVSKHPRHVKYLENEEIIKNICEKIILPNMQAREEDLEQFEDEPLEFIRKDLEGSDLDTRRRSASELIRGLMTHFEVQLTPLFLNYINECLNFNKNNKDWISKDTAVHTFMSIAMKGQLTQQGISQINKNLNIQNFFEENILNELENNNSHPMILVAEIKFLIIFRNQLNISNKLPNILLGLLKNNNSIVKTYSSICLEKYLKNELFLKSLFLLKDEILISLINLLDFDTKIKPNEYAIRTLWKILFLGGKINSEKSKIICEKLLNYITEASNCLINSKYNHYLFECLVSTLKNTDASFVLTIENVIIPCLQNILIQDVSDFVPYVLQVYYILLSFHKNNIPEIYKSLLPIIQQPILWETNSNIPSIIKLLKGFLIADSNFISQQFLQMYFGIFQKLVQSKSYDHLAFELLDSIVSNLSISIYQQYLQSVFMLIFQRLQSNKTPKFIHELTIFISTFILSNDSNSPILFSTIESIQQNLFIMLMQQILLPELPKISDKYKRNLCSNAFSKLLLLIPQLFQQGYDSILPILISNVLQGLPQSNVQEDPENAFLFDDDSNIQLSFKLVSLGNEKIFLQLPNAIDTFSHVLKSSFNAHPGKVIFFFFFYLDPICISRR
ncbi:Exportin/Importin, Cse1-like domain-containing protein [Rozella allomycis CSF55]|uniref:Exportin/Importin, Cse1-like domain-containing protein n=1 Tax=Rozella allomycis (strain CSF55) TaxID=988480 RepID=A0A075AS52_ROZAC|nr:Exportin/Importin, Cse1-like domain-containing protein [Rozella allomycis CSF55]|eukprot:EPZ31546.1 Exportin/Importin, Cse1-like domain-containing protein [Rozella allomycis CSF55]